jgi:DNA-binding CsgD family transcriptional regulator
VPLKNAEGVYYWVLQESYPLQVSNDGQMLAQFNTYTVVSKYDKPQEMIGWISGKMGLNSEQDGKLKYFFNKISTFTLTNKERELIKTVQNLPEMPYREIAQIQNVQDITIKQHAKNITKKAKEAFPHFFKKEDIVTLKSVASYLHQLDFDHQNEEIEPGESA